MLTLALSQYERRFGDLELDRTDHGPITEAERVEAEEYAVTIGVDGDFDIELIEIETNEVIDHIIGTT